MATKSLGTLTLDLVAKTGSFVQGMTKSQRSAQRWRKGVERDIKRVGTAFAGLSTIAAGAFSAMVVQTVNSARELERFAQISDTSTQSFQRIAYGAQRFGVDQEKLADILKDVNDRVGDFIQTGGGPMADFFENIAPKVGVTADEFARLSGPEALQLYVASLEAAGLSQKDMTFYMEAIASDATALIPLLRDGGKEMNRLGKEAEQTGNVFSDLEMDQLAAIKDGMDELSGAASGMKNQLVLGALPAIEDMVDLLSDPETLANAQALGEAIVTSMEWAVEALKSTIQFAQNLGTELGVVAVGIGGLEIEEQIRRIDDALENPSQRLRFFGPEGLVAWNSEAELRARRGELVAMLQAGSPATLPVEFEANGAEPGDGRSMMESFIGQGMELASTGLERVGVAAEGAADALDGFNPANSEEVQSILDRAGEGSSIDASGQIRDAWGNTLPTLQRELDAELKRQVADFQSAQNLNAGLEAAAQAFVDGASVAAKAAWASIQPANDADVAAGVVPTAEQAANGTSTIRWSTDLGAEKAGQAASRVSAGSTGSTGGGSKQIGTLTLKSEAGSVDVFTENAAAAEKWLADTLSGVAAGSR